MAESPALTREAFAALVHDALAHLYDSPRLQAHPLGEALLGASSAPRGQALRRLLLDALEALRPPPGVPTQARDWRAYRALELRYVEGCSPSEVMAQLALGRSQFFRDQAQMLDMLVDALWLARPPQPAPQHQPPAAPAHAEVARVLAHACWEPVDAGEVVRALRPVLEPIAVAQGVRLALSADAAAPIANADRVLLRQVVLQLSRFAMQTSGANRISVQVEAEPATHISISANGTGIDQGAGTAHGGLSLEDCRQLVAAMGGTLEVRAAYNGWQATCAWRPAGQPVLLAIDDNADFIELLRRYLAGQPWRVLGAADGAAARRVLADITPTLIVLDVMLPREDGWELLLALRSSEATRAIPVLICSGLREPDLAPALGAAGYLAKPVEQEALLEALAAAHLSPLPR